MPSRSNTAVMARDASSRACIRRSFSALAASASIRLETSRLIDTAPRSRPSSTIEAIDTSACRTRPCSVRWRTLPVQLPLLIRLMAGPPLPWLAGPYSVVIRSSSLRPSASRSGMLYMRSAPAFQRITSRSREKPMMASGIASTTRLDWRIWVRAVAVSRNVVRCVATCAWSASSSVFIRSSVVSRAVTSTPRARSPAIRGVIPRAAIPRRSSSRAHSGRAPLNASPSMPRIAFCPDSSAALNGLSGPSSATASRAAATTSRRSASPSCSAPRRTRPDWRTRIAAALDVRSAATCAPSSMIATTSWEERDMRAR